MRIAMIHDAIYPFVKGGAEKRLYEISRRLAKRHDIHVFGMKWWDGPDVIKRDGVTIHGIYTGKLYSGSRRSIKSALLFSKNLLNHLSGEQFDVIDCYQAPYIHAYAAKIAAKSARLVLTWHEVWSSKRYDYWKAYLGRFGIVGKTIERTVLKLPHIIIAVSDRTKQDLANIGVDARKIKVVPNGVNFDKIRAIKSAKKKFDVLFVGRLMKHKNVDFLIKSIATLKKSRPHVKCGIIGMGPEFDGLKNLASDLALDRNVEFLGFLESEEEVFAHMKSSKVLAFPSTREGFGMVVIEANACGLPVVTVEHEMNAAADLVTNGVNGFVVGFSVAEFAKKLGCILDDRNLRVSLGRQAMNTAKRYDWDKIAVMAERVYSGGHAL